MRLVEYEPGVGHLLLVLLLPFSWAFFVDQTTEEALNYSFSSNKKWPTFVDCCRCRGRRPCLSNSLWIEKASENYSVSDSQREQQNNNWAFYSFEIEKNSLQTFRITYFIHEVYKRKLEHVPTSRVPIFWRFVVFTHRRSPYVTLPLTKYHSKTEVEQERLVCLWFLKEEFVVFCNIEKILKKNFFKWKYFENWWHKSSH